MNYSNLGIYLSYTLDNEIYNKYGVMVNSVGLQSVNSNFPYPAKAHLKGYYFDTIKESTINEYQFTTFEKDVFQFVYMFFAQIRLPYVLFLNIPIWDF